MREITAVRDGQRNGLASSIDLEVANFIERHRSPSATRSLAMPPDLVYQRLELGDHRITATGARPGETGNLCLSPQSVRVIGPILQYVGSRMPKPWG